MTQHEFQEEEDAVNYVVASFKEGPTALTISEGLLPQLAREVVAMWIAPEETIQPRWSRPAHIAKFKWVIRDEDLKLLDSILDGMKAAAGANFFVLASSSLSGGTVAAVGIFACFLKLAYNARKKGVSLDPRAYSVFEVLSERRVGLTDKEILVALVEKDPSWTFEDVHRTLNTLSEAESSSGKIQLVWKKSDETWRLNGV